MKKLNMMGNFSCLRPLQAAQKDALSSVWQTLCHQTLSSYGEQVYKSSRRIERLLPYQGIIGWVERTEKGRELVLGKHTYQGDMVSLGKDGVVHILEHVDWCALLTSHDEKKERQTVRLLRIPHEIQGDFLIYKKQDTWKMQSVRRCGQKAMLQKKTPEALADGSDERIDVRITNVKSMSFVRDEWIVTKIDGSIWKGPTLSDLKDTHWLPKIYSMYERCFWGTKKIEQRFEGIFCDEELLIPGEAYSHYVSLMETNGDFLYLVFSTPEKESVMWKWNIPDLLKLYKNYRKKYDLVFTSDEK